MVETLLRSDREVPLIVIRSVLLNLCLEFFNRYLRGTSLVKGTSLDFHLMISDLKTK